MKCHNSIQLSPTFLLISTRDTPGEYRVIVLLSVAMRCPVILLLLFPTLCDPPTSVCVLPSSGLVPILSVDLQVYPRVIDL